MRFKILGLVAVATLVAACGTASDESSSSSGAGSATASQPSTATTAPTTPARMATVPGSQDDLVVNVGDRVFFGFDKYSLTASARATLEKQAAWMNKHPAVTVALEGHADERGTREYNLGLGDRRANSVKDYLVALGINPNRLKAISYGKERPVALGSNEAAWAQNRRSVTMVTGGAGS